MSTREKSEINQFTKKINDQTNNQTDKRVKMIYDRYHSGKSIIMDDLQYLWMKDPEGCKKLAKSIVESKVDQVRETESNTLMNGVYVEKSIETGNEKRNYIEYHTTFDTPADSLDNIAENITSVKLMLENMSESELLEMMNHLNEAVELKKLTNKMKYWDDNFTDKMIQYTYEDMKEFNILA
ncbi:MAG: hypothetical protein K0S47_3643 [Herbinix sp.]|jgi:hypothetical protein|nr:hypothetical protein [Herbinix sp.]